jgi:hypothetical protein
MQLKKFPGQTEHRILRMLRAVYFVSREVLWGTFRKYVVSAVCVYTSLKRKGLFPKDWADLKVVFGAELPTV